MPYFDHAATTKISPNALKAMQDILEHIYGNPSSLHEAGIEARKIMNQAKNKLAKLMNCQRKELIMTGSGTEANNLAIKGTYFLNPDKRYITTTIEHHATDRAMRFIKTLGADVVKIPVDHAGFIDMHALETALKTDTALVSIIYANNEIGTIQAIDKIRNLTNKYGAKLHLDMIQAPLHEPIDTVSIDVDFISISAHKFHGPNGAALLYVKEGTPIENLIHGGNQEFKKRAGTENLAGIVGMSVAFEEALHNQKTHNATIDTLSEYFIKKLKAAQIDFRLNGPTLKEKRLKNILNIAFKDQDNQTLSFKLNQKGIYVSLGSACDSDNIEPSHVIKAIKVPKHYIDSALRFSLSDEHTTEDIDYTVDTIKSLIE